MDLELESCNPIFIKKTFQQQKNDFLRILDFENKLLASQVRDYFKDALELVMEPTGWVAFWKISRDYCSQNNLSYPAIVVVQVENVDFNNLVAAVKLITDEEDITLPEKIPDVPLIQLFPTMEQLFDSIDIHKTADILHDLRVFFNVLWYPWDDIVNRNEDWLSLHFENRLKLHYDIASGSIQRNVCITIENLINEGKQLYERINSIEEQLMHLDSNNCNSPKLSDIVASDRRFLELSQLQLKLNYIADQLTFYENSNIRKLLEKTSDTKEVATQNQGQCISLAWTCGTPEDLSIVMSKVNKFIIRDSNQEDNMRFRCSESLEKLLIDSSETEKIFLSKGTYCLKSHILPNRKGGVIQGLNNRDEVIITDEEECCCLIDISSEEISLNNIEIRASKVSFILVVRVGKCNLNNVKISDNNSKKIGISVHSGAKLFADNCHFYGCLAAIHADKDSSVILRNCIFENNINGLEFEEGNIAIESCKFVSNQGNAIVMESSGDKIDNIKTGQDVLEDLDGVKMTNTTFDGNKNDIAKHY